MKKSIILLSTIAAFTTASFAEDVNKQMYEQLQLLKKQVAELEAKMNEQNSKVEEKRITKIEKKLTRVSKTATAAKIQSAADNIKWDVDFRTQVDNIQYKHADGSKSKNNALLTNRLLLGAKYQADENSSFFAKLAYNKAFGDTADHSQSNTNPGYANFDWVTNENATDNTVKIKEAYWLYSNDTLFDADIPWTVSIGRRPSTDGLPINIRNNQKANSPLSHVVDVEFDGFSVKFDTEETTGWTGSWLKICGGRGLTNATPRFDMFSPAYSTDNTKNIDVDMLGIIAVPYDDGQYSVHFNYARAWNLIGYDGNSINQFYGAYGNYQNASQTYQQTPTSNNLGLLNDSAFAMNIAAPSFKDVGDIDFATILFKTEGIGDGISDYLDDTTVFASFAMSKTRPNSLGMLGSKESETGTSVWLGVNAACPISPDDSRIGFEWNKGSKYWRSMTNAEDTYAGSKIAVRGQAWEVYRNQKLTDALSFGVSYVYIDYDYAGSNSFFGEDGNPNSTLDVVSAQDVRAYMRYKF